VGRESSLQLNKRRFGHELLRGIHNGCANLTGAFRQAAGAAAARLGPKRYVIHAVYPSKRGLLPSVRALLDYLGARYSELRED
jgi:hypothetical protein